MTNCPHNWVNDGPRIPLRWGSAATEICCDCGSWRDIRPPIGPWQPAAALAEQYVDWEEARAPSDSGGGAKRENSRSEVEAEGPQSGGEAASPKGEGHA